MNSPICVHSGLTLGCPSCLSHMASRAEKAEARVAILESKWRAECFANGECCPFCGWDQPQCECKRTGPSVSASQSHKTITTNESNTAEMGQKPDSQTIAQSHDVEPCPNPEPCPLHPRDLWTPNKSHPRKSPLAGLAEAAPDLRLTAEERAEIRRRAEIASAPFTRKR